MNQSKTDRHCTFKITQSITFGILYPKKPIINALKEYCFKKGLTLTMLDDGGFLWRTYHFLIQGEGTESFANAVKDTLKGWFESLANDNDNIFG